MQHRPSSETYSRSTSLEIPCLFWNTSKGSAIGAYSEPDEPSPEPHTLLFKIDFNIHFPHTLRRPYGLFPFYGSKPKFCMHSSCPPCVLFASLLQSSLFYDPNNVWWRAVINYETLLCAIFFLTSVLSPCKVQIFSSKPFSRSTLNLCMFFR
jgi:hypothetical protein